MSNGKTVFLVVKNICINTIRTCICFVSIFFFSYWIFSVLNNLLFSYLFSVHLVCLFRLVFGKLCNHCVRLHCMSHCHCSARIRFGWEVCYPTLIAIRFSRFRNPPCNLITHTLSLDWSDRLNTFDILLRWHFLSIDFSCSIMGRRFSSHRQWIYRAVRFICWIYSIFRQIIFILKEPHFLVLLLDRSFARWMNFPSLVASFV